MRKSETGLTHYAARLVYFSIFRLKSQGGEKNFLLYKAAFKGIMHWQNYSEAPFLGEYFSSRDDISAPLR